MKKRIICFIIALIMTALPLVSCGDGTGNAASDAETGGSGEFTVGRLGSDVYAWGDFIFEWAYMKGEFVDYVAFHDVKAPTEDWLPLGCDLVGGTPAGKNGMIPVTVEEFAIIVDDMATAENSGVPVFVIVYTVKLQDKDNSHNTELETVVSSYNMRTRKLSIIKDGIYGVRVNGEICLYHGSLFFCTSPVLYAGVDSVFFIDLNKVNLDGSGYAVFEGEKNTPDGNAEMITPSIGYIADDIVYLSEGGKIYSSDLDFSEVTYLFDAADVCCVDGEYIYYLVDEDHSYDGTGKRTLWRRKKDDFSSPAELLFSSGGTGKEYDLYCGCYGKKLYFVHYNEDGTADVNVFDAVTNKLEKFITLEGHGSVRFATDRYVIILSYYDAGYVCIDTEDGSSTSIEPWHNA